MMTALNPKTSIKVKNVGSEDIPPRSVVVITAVTLSEETDEQESELVASVKRYQGEDGTFVVTGSAVIKKDEHGVAFFDQFIYVAISPSDTPAEGAEYGPVSGNFHLTSSGTGFIAVGHDGNDATPKMSLFYRAPQTSGDETSGGGCGCCDCAQCIDAATAVVGACAACPNGAAREYETHIGTWDEFPELSDALQFLLGIQTADCDASSSSSSSSISPGSGCEWSTCLISVTRPDPSASSSSSSSAATVTGVYQWIFDADHVDGPGFYLHFISGVDLVYDWV